MMWYSVCMANVLQKLRSCITWRRVVLCVVVLLMLQVISTFVCLVMRQSWTQAFESPGTVKKVSVAYDKDGTFFSARPDIIRGSSGHWIGKNATDDEPSVPDIVWYDGKIVAQADDIYDFTISRDGLHYAYLQASTVQAGASRLFVDGVEKAGGLEMRIVHLPNDPSQIYVKCDDCGGSAGIFRGDVKVAQKEDILDQEVGDWSRNLCLDQSIDYVKKIFSDMYDSSFSCSADGRMILKNTNKPHFITGSYSSISVNGWGIVDGTIIDAVVDNNGRVSYFDSDYVRGDELVISGRRYVLDGELKGGSNVLFDSERQHVAILYSDGRGWWYDGQPTGAGSSDVISIEGDSFYIYQAGEQEEKIK